MRFAIRGCLLAAALSAPAVAGGCGGDDETSGTEGGITLEQLPTAYADVVCDAFEGCFGVLGDVLADAETCKPETAKQVEDTVVQQIKGFISAGTVAYNPGKVQACLDAIKSGGCDVLDGGTPAVCEEAVEGKVARGGDCNAAIECAGADFCEFTTSACPGKCAALRPEGASCNANEECQDGLTCQADATPTEQKCRAPAKVGEACEGPDGRDCVAGTICVGEDQMKSGTCKLAGDLSTSGQGESCDPGKDILCQEGLSCVIDAVSPMATFKCAAPSSPGGTCRLGIPDPCPSDEFCDADFAGGKVEGICHKLPNDGQPCAKEGFGLGAPCAVGHVCDGTDTCRLRQRIGASCVEDGVCYSDTCESGKCAAPPACDAPETP